MFWIPAFAGMTLFWCLLTCSLASAAEPANPAGFFVQNIDTPKAVPVFYNLDTHHLQAFPLNIPYHQFIDVFWDRDSRRVFFSAQRSSTDTFRVYVKEWPAGAEKPVYENPLGPFRFLLSPDGKRFAFQVMGPAAWPILAVHELETQRTTLLGQGYSPDWSVDGQRLLFLSIPGSLPSWLHEYRVDTDTSTRLLPEPVMEAAYTDDPEQIVLKTAAQSKKCDVFQLWNRRKNTFSAFVPPEGWPKTCTSQRELAAFPGHQFFYFKESKNITRLEEQHLIVVDAWGGRLQDLSREDWEPRVIAVDPTTLVVGKDPLYILRADGTGGRIEIQGVELVRPRTTSVPSGK